MGQFSKFKISRAISDVSINLASGYLGVLLISPGFLGADLPNYLNLVFTNLPPAILSLIFGIVLMQNEE